MANSRRILRKLGMLTLAAALGACGSGGGDDATDGTSAGGGSGSTAAAGSGATGSTGAGSGSDSGSSSGSGAGIDSGSAAGTGGSGTAGGGASSGSPAAAGNVPTAGTLQITAPAANYAAGSAEIAAWRDLNTVRIIAGAGWLVQSNDLDTAAAAHANYLVRNIGATGHAEEQDKTDYYAASPGSRVTKAGFAASFVTETISDYRTLLGSLQDPGCAGELLNSVYNAVALLGPATHVGLRGWVGTYSGAQFCIGLVAAPSTRPEGQVVAAGKMVTYPYDGQTDVIESVNLQVESPRPSSTLLPNDLAGAPVIVNVRNAEYLNLGITGSLNVQVTKFEMSDPSSGNLVPAAILAHAALKGSGGVVLNEDSNLPVGAVVLVPLSPLLRGHVYTISFSATLRDGGPALQKTWSFTTRP
jgi:hypothetical protein